MKKIIALLIVAALLIGTLTGCIIRRSDVDAFLALWDEFMEQREYSFTGEMTMRSEDPEVIAMGMEKMDVSMAGMVSLDRLEMEMTMTLSLMEEMPDVEIDAFVTEDEILFDMGGMLQFVFDLMFEQMGMGFLSISVDELLEGNRFVALPISMGQNATDALFAPVFVGQSLTYEELTEHLTREQDVFTLTLEGEILERAMDDVMEMMNQFSFDFGEFAGELGLDDMELNWEEIFQDIDYSEARLVTSLSRDEDGFRQIVEWDIPGVSTSRMESVYLPREIEPLHIPEAMTISEFVEFIEELDFAEMFPDLGGAFGDEFDDGPGPLVYDVVYDLAGLNLVGHNLPANSLLQTVALPDGFGGEHIVTVAAGDPFFPEEWSLDSGTERLWFRYISWYNMEAAEAVNWMAKNDWEIFYSEMTVSAMHTNAEYSLAIMAGEVLADGVDQYVFIYMAQVIPETEDVVLLDMTLAMDFLGEEEYAVIAEFGEHIGVDLLALISELLG